MKTIAVNERVIYCIYRYALGRMTGIVSTVCDELIRIWPELSDREKEMLKREIEEAFAKDDASREKGGGSFTWHLGMNCDRRQWERVRALWGGSTQ